MKRTLKEIEKITPNGYIEMTLFKGKYDIKNNKIDGEIIKKYDEHNLIVKVASKFMAGRMVPNNSVPHVLAKSTNNEVSGVTTSTTSYETSTLYPLPNGFQYLALGNGALNEQNSEQEKATYLYSADITMTTEEQQGLTHLQNELIRKPFVSWCFLNPADDSISDTPTNVLRLSTLFDEEDIKGEWIVEMGLFGGDATDDKDTGHMFNYKLFKSWNKIEGSSLLINWIITF